MAKSEKYNAPQGDKQREAYKGLLTEQQQLLAKVRRGIEVTVDRLSGEIELNKNTINENEEKLDAKNMQAINALVRISQALVKIIPLELELASIEVSASMHDTYVQVTDPDYLAMMDKYADEWQEQRRQHAAAVAAEEAQAGLNNGQGENDNTHR